MSETTPTTAPNAPTYRCTNCGHRRTGTTVPDPDCEGCGTADWTVVQDALGHSRPRRDVAEDLLDYCRDHPGVTLSGSVHGWTHLRVVDDEIRVIRAGGEHRRKQYIHGDILDTEAALSWVVSNPARPVPIADAGPHEQSLWELAAQQGVFANTDRCYYCGADGRQTDLTYYETTEQGECLFCPDCHAAWETAGEIVREAGESDE